MARGKKPVILDKAELQEAINKVETIPFKNRGDLYAALITTDWAQNMLPRPLTIPVIMKFVKKFTDLQILTPIGKRGSSLIPRVAGQTGIKGPRKKKEVKPAIISLLKKTFPVTLHSAVDALARGSKKAIIKCMCNECCQFARSEITNCTVKRCPLWSFRPYQVGEIPPQPPENTKEGTVK